MAMNGYYEYQLYQGERDRTRAEIMDADLRLGQMAAAAARLTRSLCQGLSRDLRRGPRQGVSRGRRRGLHGRLSRRFVWPDRVQED
jgi:hypothetical protein